VAALPVEEVQEAQSGAGHGLFYTNEVVRRVPWSINLLKMDRSRSDLELTTTLGRGRTIGLSVLSHQIERLPDDFGKPVAAVNGDFYRTEFESYSGDPRGLQIQRGELISGPNGKTAFWIDEQGNPHMGDVVSKFEVTWPDGETMSFGLNEERDSNDAVLYSARAGSSTRARGGREFILVRDGESPWLPLRPGQSYRAIVKEVRSAGNSRLSRDILVLSVGPTLVSRLPAVAPGTAIQISTATKPDLLGVRTALGGGPVLLRNGKPQPTHTNKAGQRHPRTAFGWNDDYFFFVQVDGRQGGFSVGMTLPEMATYLARQRCQEAMNLDGGGSSEMWIQGEVVNRPCFGHERETANALVVIQRTKLVAKEPTDDTAGTPSAD
jgi:hypothetical protein